MGGGGWEEEEEKGEPGTTVPLSAILPDRALASTRFLDEKLICPPLSRLEGIDDASLGLGILQSSLGLSRDGVNQVNEHVQVMNSTFHHVIATPGVSVMVKNAMIKAVKKGLHRSNVDLNR